MSPTETVPSPAPGWSSQAKAALAARGFRAGEARTAVVELLGAAGGCLEADQVIERLRKQGSPVGTASVYRALALLTELGLLHKVALPDAPARYDLITADGEHHHHIVCDDCGLTEPFSDPELERAIDHVSRRSSFEVEAHDITLHGRCAGCRA